MPNLQSKSNTISYETIEKWYKIYNFPIIRSCTCFVQRRKLVQNVNFDKMYFQDENQHRMLINKSTKSFTAGFQTSESITPRLRNEYYPGYRYQILHPIYCFLLSFKPDSLSRTIIIGTNLTKLTTLLITCKSPKLHFLSLNNRFSFSSWKVLNQF